jgi:hypothetical protein
MRSSCKHIKQEVSAFFQIIIFNTFPTTQSTRKTRSMTYKQTHYDVQTNMQ